jgi:hypothetical protein
MKAEIFIINRSDSSMEVGLEPDGDAVSLRPNDTCIVRAMGAEPPGFGVK